MRFNLVSSLSTAMGALSVQRHRDGRYTLGSAGAIVAVLLAWALVAVPGPACAENNRDSIALIIGNKDYSKANTFDVRFAYNDAEAMKTFVIQRLGYRPGNVIVLRDATLGQLVQWFGDASDPQGNLWNRARPRRSNIFVYYSGHGAPDIKSRRPYLIPTDVDPKRASRGYSLDTLMRNLGALKKHLGDQAEVVAIFESCFSGRTGGGALLEISGGLIPNLSPPGAGVLRISASRASEVANWNTTKRLGLFTSVFLEAVSGKADEAPAGNGNGIVDWKEIAGYVDDKVAYRARSIHGRDQVPELPKSSGPAWQFRKGETDDERKLRQCREEPVRWEALKKEGNGTAIRRALMSFQCPVVHRQVSQWIERDDKRNRQARLADERLKEIDRQRQELERQKQEIERQRQRLEEERRRSQNRPVPQQTPTPSPPPQPPPQLDNQQAVPQPPAGTHRVVGVEPNDPDGLNVRSMPSTRGGRLFSIPFNGTGIRVGQCLRVPNGSMWCEVTYRGRTGWASARYLAPMSSSPPPMPTSNQYRVVNVEPDDPDGGLNLRSTPGARRNRILTVIPYNGVGITLHRCISRYGRQWCQITYQGVTGWVNARYIAR